jgi:uncharacterized protein (DUF924 family)
MKSEPAPLFDPDAVLDFWFGKLDDTGRADKPHADRWWSKDAAIDAEIKERFAALHTAVIAGRLSSWLDRPHSRLAYIIVLDQFSRNIYRGTPAMFGADETALYAALSGIDVGMDRQLPQDERSFFYMPLMHSEQLALQERCVDLYQTLSQEVSGRARAAMLQTIGFAERHRDIVKRFGRFPHRNAILGRTSTPDEQLFLDGPGASF